MSDFKAIVDSSFEGTIFPLWLYNQDYIYGMIPADSEGLRLKEVSYTFEESDEPLFVTERAADLSYQFLLEEIIKAVPFYVENFNVNKMKEFTKGIEAKPGTEKIKEIINELIINSHNYSSNLPVIKNKEESNKLKEKLD